MKKLYGFSIWKENEKDGVKTYAERKFFLRKPSRAMIDDAELYYSLEYSNNIKLGLLTKEQLATKFSDEVSTFSKKDRENYIASYTALMDAETAFQGKALKKPEERTDAEKKEVEELAGKIIDLRQELQNIENGQQSLFDHTAEVRARNKLITWWTFHLAYNADEKPFFGEGDYNARLKQYDVFDEEEDPFNLSVARKLIYLVSFWYTGRAENQADFDKIASVVGVNINPEQVKKEDTKTEEASPPQEVKA